jgi:hypothetical protein
LGSLQRPNPDIPDLEASVRTNNNKALRNPDDLDALLSTFIVSIRKPSGQLVHRNTLMTIMTSVQRLFTDMRFAALDKDGNDTIPEVMICSEHNPTFERTRNALDCACSRAAAALLNRSTKPGQPHDSSIMSGMGSLLVGMSATVEAAAPVCTAAAAYATAVAGARGC